MGELRLKNRQWGESPLEEILKNWNISSILPRPILSKLFTSSRSRDPAINFEITNLLMTQIVSDKEQQWKWTNKT